MLTEKYREGQSYLHCVCVFEEDDWLPGEELYEKAVRRDPG